jgi:hypothetical protein
MSRIRRLSQVISEEGRRALASQQASRIRDTAFGIVDEANLNASTSRKITKKAAFTVVLRSLQSTRNLPFSLREHMAIKELSQYITLAQSDKSNSLTLSNTDLLPVSHPRSTRNHSMTASALLEARARWVADDPRIVDGYAKTIIASALTSKYASVEHVYYNSILSSLPQGVVPAEVIVAASNPFSGGNSSAERSLRARLQRRDREGKFAFMGGGLSALVRKSNGRVYNLVGRPIVDGPSGDDIQMELPDGKIVNIPASKGMFIKAVINPTPDGYSKDTAKTATTKNIINEEDLVFVDAPKGWSKTGTNTWSSEDGWSIEKGRDKNGFFQYEIKDPAGKTTGTSSGDWEDALDSIAEKKEGKKAVLPSDDNMTDEIIMDPPKDGGNGGNGGGGDGEGPKPPKPFEFKYPQGAVKIKIDESYDPEGRVEEESPDFTDDPVELGQKFDPRDLVQALEQGVLPENEGDNAIGYGVLRFNGGDEYVPVQAIYNALDEAGEDAPLALARIYDKALGGNDNENALKDNRKGVARLDQSKPDVAESFERTIAMSPDEVPATQAPKFSEAEINESSLPPVLEGLSDAEMKQFMETGDHTPYLSENESIDMPEGYNTLDSSPFSSWREVTADTPDAVLPEGFSDNPVFLAQSIDKQSLEAELRRSIEPDSATPGYANISLQDEDGEEFVANVPGEAVRDALQLQGVDTNALIKSIADEGFAGQKDEPIAELPDAPFVRPGVDDEGNVKTLLPDGYQVSRKDSEISPDLAGIRIEKDGEEVGFLFWNKDTKVIENIEIKPGHRGKKLATSAWKAAKEVEPELKHAEYRTPSGDRFAHSTGDFVPPLIPMGDWTQKDLDEAQARAENKEQKAELPLDMPAEPKPMNAYERLMAEKKAEADAVEKRVAKLKKDAEDGVDDLGRPIPEGWGAEYRRRGLDADPDNFYNAYGNNTFEAIVDKDGKITVRDRNDLIPDKSYDNWDDLKADLANQRAEYSSAARARVAEIAKQYGYSDEQIASFDSMSQQELADFFANPDNHTPAYADALVDWVNSFAVDRPSPQQKARWSEFGKNEKILAQAGDAPSKSAENPLIEKPALDRLVSEINKNDGYEANGLNFRINTGAFGAKDDNIEVTPINWEPGDPIVARIDMDGGIDWQNDAQYDKYAEAFNQAIQGINSPNEIGDESLVKPALDENKLKELEAEREKYVAQEKSAPSEQMQTKARIRIQQIDAEIARLKGTLPSDPKAMGKEAFAKGKKRVASVDPDLNNLMEGKSSAEKDQLMRDWYEGWDNANIDAPIDDEDLLNRRLAGESLDVVAEDLGISREEVRRREMNALRKRREENPEAPLAPTGLDKPENKEAVAAFNREYVKELLDQEEALADKYEAEEDMPRGDAQAVAEADMKRMYGKTAGEALAELPRDEALKVLNEREDKIDEEVVPDISEPPTQSDVVRAVDVNSPNLQEEIQSAIDKGQKIAFSYNGKERVVLPKGIWTNPKNGNVNLRAIEDGTDGGLKVFTLDKMEMAKVKTPAPAEAKPKELSEGDKAVIKNNAFVEENAGSLQPIAAEDVQVGDFIWNAFHGRYEEVLSNKYAGVMNRMEMEVFNVKNGQREIRYFEMDSPLRNVRRPGVEDQAEPIPSAKAAPRGGKRNVIKRKAPSERVVAKEGRQMGGNFEKEGFYRDMNGVALVPGDVVMHRDPSPGKGGKWKRGVVKLRIGAQVEEGKKAGAVGRKGIAYLDYLIVQWEGEDVEAALNQGGRQVKAKNLVKFDGSVDGMVMPEFRGGNVKPNAPANPAPAAEPRRFPPTTGERQAIERPVAPEQGRLVDTPEVKPPAPAAPGIPKAVYKAEVEDQKGNKFKISVVKIDDVYEAAVFNENGDLNAVIAKDVSLGEIQGVIGKFIGDVADSNDGEKVLRAYGGFPDPAEQLVLESDTPAVPPLPEVETIELKEAKARAKALADRIQDKELPGDARKDLSDNEQARMKSYLQQYLSPSGVDRRQNGKFNDELRVAYRYAVRLGWFDEARDIVALQKRVDKLPLREGGEDFNNKIEELRNIHPEFFNMNMELELAKRLDYNGRKKVESLINAFHDMILYPDVYNPNFRSALIKGRADIDAILASIDRPNPVPADAEVIDRLKELKQRFDAIGDLPKLPSREKGNDDMQNHLADVAREFEGLSINDLRNGVGDWKFDKELSAGINKVYLLRNALTGERIVVKYDNDGNRGVFKGNGIKAEEMVAALYRDLGFAQPAFVAVNPDNPNVEVGGVGVMQYADAGFFNLVDIEVHNRSAVYSLDAVAAEHRAELLNFMVANAIIGNSDRHGGNFMWGTDPATGKVRLVPIDNGLAIFNAGFGKPQESPNDPLYVNPLKVIGGDYGNRNQVGRLGKKWVQEIGEEAAKNQVIEFATRMRERAEAMKFVDPKANEYLMARADYILKNPQKFIDTLLKFW